MITVNTHDAKTNFSSLLHSVEINSETILVCRNGHPIAEIHPLNKPKRKGLPVPDRALALKINYDPTEPLGDEDLPEVCK
jgi:antitoxin (DNA-binding transcriptional repressor) of toxin-antitoxin stability system